MKCYFVVCVQDKTPGGSLGVKVGTHVRTQNRVKRGLFGHGAGHLCVLFRDMKIVKIEY
jgi:hypothetical protein